MRDIFCGPSSKLSSCMIRPQYDSHPEVARAPFKNRPEFTCFNSQLTNIIASFLGFFFFLFSQPINLNIGPDLNCMPDCEWIPVPLLKVCHFTTVPLLFVQ